MKRVEIESKRTLLDEKFTVTETKLRFERFNGQMSATVSRLVFERGDSAAALLLNRDTQKVILIEQFRYPTYEKGPGWLLEIVAGVIDKDEQPEETIRREIREEIGYEVHDLTYIATFYVSPGGTSERILLYYSEVGDADRVSAGGGKASEHEDIQQVDIALADLWAKLDNAEILDAKTLVAAQWLRRKLEQKG
jgi:nudix-type nucleoside diphosphatase (YffH/AdpP family)